MGWRFPHALRATWEFRASVHEPTEGASLFQICVTAFAYISILSSVLFFLFSGMIFLIYFFSFSPLVWTPAQAVEISRTTVHSWSSGSHIRTNTQTRFQPTLVNRAFFFHPIMIDHVRIQSDVLRSRSGTDEKSLPDNTHQFLQLPMLSVAPCFSFSPIWSDWQCNESFFLSLPPSLPLLCLSFFFFGQTFWTVHRQILYKIAI